MNAATLQAKNLTILEDQMQHEFLACKKAEHYATAFEDVQLGNLARQIADCHRQRYDRLFSYLNSHA